jgi:hypothetical protein
MGYRKKFKKEKKQQVAELSCSIDALGEPPERVKELAERITGLLEKEEGVSVPEMVAALLLTSFYAQAPVIEAMAEGDPKFAKKGEEAVSRAITALSPFLFKPREETSLPASLGILQGLLMYYTGLAHCGANLQKD